MVDSDEPNARKEEAGTHQGPLLGFRVRRAYDRWTCRRSSDVTRSSRPSTGSSVGTRGVPSGRFPGRRRLREVRAAGGDGRPGTWSGFSNPRRPPRGDRGRAPVRRPDGAAGTRREVTSTCPPRRGGRWTSRCGESTRTKRTPSIHLRSAWRCGALRSLSAGTSFVALDDVQWWTHRRSERSALRWRRADSNPSETRGAPVGAAPDIQIPAPDGRIVDVEVGPLEEAAFGTVVRRGAGARLPLPVVRRVHAACDGNPLFGKEVGG